MWVKSLGWEEPLEESMATHFSILAWRIPSTEEPGGLWSIGSHKVKQDWSDLAHTQGGRYLTELPPQSLPLWPAPLLEELPVTHICKDNCWDARKLPDPGCPMPHPESTSWPKDTAVSSAPPELHTTTACPEFNWVMWEASLTQLLFP